MNNNSSISSLVWLDYFHDAFDFSKCFKTWLPYLTWVLLISKLIFKTMKKVGMSLYTGAGGISEACRPVFTESRYEPLHGTVLQNAVNLKRWWQGLWWFLSSYPTSNEQNPNQTDNIPNTVCPNGQESVGLESVWQYEFPIVLLKLTIQKVLQGWLINRLKP